MTGRVTGLGARHDVRRGPFARGCVFAAVAVVTVAVATVTAARPTRQSGQDGFFTTEQSNRGQALYDEQCASCHGGLRDFAPGMAALLGDHTFRSRWTGRPLGELFALVIETMPQDAPGTLSSDETADLVAYILNGHRFPVGTTPLTNDIETLMAIPFAR